MVCPSNTAGKYGAINTTSSFTINLPKAIDLEGNWSVALTEITYRNSVPNVTDTKRVGEIYADNTIKLSFKKPDESGKAVVVNRYAYLPPGQYGTVADLETALNDAITEVIMVEAKNLHKPHGKKVKIGDAVDPEVLHDLDKKKQENRMTFFRHDYVTKLMQLTVPEDFECIQLSGCLSYMTGLVEKMCTEGVTKVAKFPPDLKAGLDNMYVYCNIVSHSVVGDSLVQLLRHVPVMGKYGDLINLPFNPPQYVPLLSRHFESIEFTIKDHNNQNIPFAYGTIVLVLHFRNENSIHMSIG